MREPPSPQAMAGAARKVRAALDGGATISRKELETLVGKPRANAVGLWIDLVRVPPSGTWERRRADLYAAAEDWVGPPEEGGGAEHLVRRYLAAFGPATRKDVAGFTGLPLKQVGALLERLDLRRFDGDLLDLPRAPLPDPGTPAPPRFLPTWDATLLVHARRTGVLPEESGRRSSASRRRSRSRRSWSTARWPAPGATRAARSRSPPSAGSMPPTGGHSTRRRSELPNSIAERLSALDASFLAIESPLSPMHVGWVASFDQPESGPTTADELIDHIAARSEGAHRYRQKLADVPMGVHDPVWVDDPDFDPARHLHAADGDVVDEVLSTPLARDRPLWEMWVTGDPPTLVGKQAIHPAWSTALRWSSSATCCSTPSPTRRPTPTAGAGRRHRLPTRASGSAARSPTASGRRRRLWRPRCGWPPTSARCPAPPACSATRCSRRHHPRR